MKLYTTNKSIRSIGINYVCFYLRMSASVSSESRANANKSSLLTLDTRFKFCPNCHNLLVVKYRCEKGGHDAWRSKCPTCPFVYPVKGKHRYIVDTFLNDDEQIDIVETSKADEHRQRTEIMCPNCNHNEAFFYQMQTRSADEPMTTFYECTNKACRNNWRD
jgi:DNA-directed RNA polymerase III subunit RPC11